ncbi:SigE family RNA polymerase sigma factor [Actinoplanes sp. NBRC 103695]|uniref:SigE family RNA polymerase sigma factor n=1 Tax=Actinoplanes sp. NBRC 103695 TaxID=3032202 RepID=UPI002555D01C|nr:SigE family RNA polymerase sigma factor [Actinoplanes sp. NBRC 103695]GLY99178.1 RNA polymerase sigma24 factor [Actinoplanes sp. NBRC 103695]
MTDSRVATSAPPVQEIRSGWGASRRRAKAARDEEFTAFVMSAGTRLRRTAYLMCRDWHLAEDLTQQAFAKMYAAWNRIRTGANLEAYSRRVLMNVVFDQQRRRSGSELVLADLPDHPDRAPAGTPELRVALVDALAQLAVKDRAVLVLRHAEDHSVETVATILGLSVPAVKMRNARALTRLRTLLGDDFPDR